MDVLSLILRIETKILALSTEAQKTTNFKAIPEKLFEYLQEVKKEYYRKVVR